MKKDDFPIGIYISNAISNNNESIPILLPEESGGFCLLYDEQDELYANQYIENIILNLLNVIDLDNIELDIFDYSFKKRFYYLSKFKIFGIYNIFHKTEIAKKQFTQLGEVIFHRHNEFLSPEIDTISKYNLNSKFKEKYHILIINLEHFPDDYISHKILVEFIESAREAGIYIIAFASKKETYEKKVQFLLDYLPNITLSQQKTDVLSHETTTSLISLIKKYNLRLKPFEIQSEVLSNAIFNKLSSNESDDAEKEFLSIPIGTSANGRVEMYFSLGDKSRNYHAFIMGMSGTGKSTLLSNIILGVAQNYTKDEMELYLMDFKEGTEFNLFIKHPNCRKIFLENKDTQAAFELLQKFNSIIEERGAIFKQKRVKDISEYNTLDSVQILPRILLIVDEAQRLFTGSYDEKDRLNQLLEDVARRGRAFGIHMILSTQTLVGTDINKELMSQISLRISYQLNNEQDCDKIFGYGNTAPLKLKRYELIYNANSGLKDFNRLCRAYPPNDVDKVIDSIRKDRGEENCLTPEIVRSNSSLKDEQSTWSFEPSENSIKISIEDKILAQLEKEGIIPEDLDKES